MKQALHVWYERLNKFLLENEFTKENINTILFLKKKNNDLLIIQIYIDVIIFGSTNKIFYQDFAKLMHGEFEMSMIGELNFFLEL